MKPIKSKRFWTMWFRNWERKRMASSKLGFRNMRVRLSQATRLRVWKKSWSKETTLVHQSIFDRGTSQWRFQWTVCVNYVTLSIQASMKGVICGRSNSTSLKDNYPSQTALLRRCLKRQHQGVGSSQRAKWRAHWPMKRLRQLYVAVINGTLRRKNGSWSTDHIETTGSCFC